ncbi:cell division protein ZipA-like [Drosophila subpulchrella]|uniref:cell division protein ZipA-like n=1 Tax=Drosophila subpulchrella TaxID=1486046 RepID=UPI0018A152AE|nr:cell division protein ZipA-like [Drosophila subpulchrella]
MVAQVRVCEKTVENSSAQIIRVVYYLITKCAPLFLLLLLLWSLWPPPKDLVDDGVHVALEAQEDQESEDAVPEDQVVQEVQGVAPEDQVAQGADQEGLEDQVVLEDQEVMEDQEALDHGDHHAIKPPLAPLRPLQALPPQQLPPRQLPPPRRLLLSPQPNPPQNPPQLPPRHKSRCSVNFENIKERFCA